MIAFVTSAARKDHKEMFERQMSSEEKIQFDPAKQKKDQELVNDVQEKFGPHEKPPSESTLRMRLVLEYRLDENENSPPRPAS